MGEVTQGSVTKLFTLELVTLFKVMSLGGVELTSATNFLRAGSAQEVAGYKCTEHDFTEMFS